MKLPDYDSTRDGNPFEFILRAAAHVRDVRQSVGVREREIRALAARYAAKQYDKTQEKTRGRPKRAPGIEKEEDHGEQEKTRRARPPG